VVVNIDKQTKTVK
jgi:hypothetical protein